MDYAERIQRVSDYIYQHLDQDLDLDQLAEIACLSRWHWHRIYQGMMGETVTATVKRLRLEHAAKQLAYSEHPIHLIAQKAGFRSNAVFSRNFSQLYGLSPQQFRQKGIHQQFKHAIISRSTTMFPVDVKELEPCSIIALAHQGDYQQIGQTFNKMYTLALKHQLANCNEIGIGLYYDDPSSTPVEQLRSYAGTTYSTDHEVPNELQKIDIQGGLYAILRYQGPYSAMPNAYEWLFGTWLPQSGYIPLDAPCMERYLNDPMTTAPNELLTEICISITEAD